MRRAHLIFSHLSCVWSIAVNLGSIILWATIKMPAFATSFCNHTWNAASWKFLKRQDRRKKSCSKNIPKTFSKECVKDHHKLAKLLVEKSSKDPLTVYRIVASTNTCYYSENQIFVQWSQYIRTKNPLHKQSEKAKTCH